MKLLIRKSIRDMLLNGLISGLLTAVFMYLGYHAGMASILAGLFIGFFSYTSITAYKRLIEYRFLQRINLMLLLVITTLVQVILIGVTAVIFIGIFYMKGQFSYFFRESSILLSAEFMVGLTFGLLLSMIFGFISITGRLIGRNIMGKLFIGKYRNPVEEERIFMFLDLTSSTAIAEKTGPMKYLSLLNDFFNDIAEPVERTKGEIYKYVGDEVIITWKWREGLRNNNCTECFRLIDRAMQMKGSRYRERYGLIPGYKAGLHGGRAVTGEVGYSKKEIAYAGDVLNTASRIMGECNRLNSRLLISEELAMRLSPREDEKLMEAGTFLLRGKEKEMKLFTVEFAPAKA